MDRVTATIVVAVLCSLLVFLARSFSDNRGRADLDAGPLRSLPRLLFRFHEVCNSLLDPKALTFLAENAPASAIASYRVRQQQLARLSLRMASDTVIYNVGRLSALETTVSVRNMAERSISRIRAGFLLIICFLGRIGLWIFQFLRAGVPRRNQLWLPARVLSAVGATVSYISHDLPEDKIVRDGWLEMCIAVTAPVANHTDDWAIGEVRAALARALPNDIARMIYIATLRDNNTGGYFHPDLARRLTLADADRAMLICHQEIYEQLVSLELEDLTDQLDVYFQSVHAARTRSIENWKKLRAYRATVPINADLISTEILFMKIDVALAVLEARLPERTQ